MTDAPQQPEIPNGIDLGFVPLQEKMGAWAVKYLEDHPEFVNYAIEKDPALPKDADLAKQELATYPGVIAIAAHEKAHEAYNTGNKLKKIQARAIAEAAHTRTGIDIHPGTKIGNNFFIDHGTGDVIGETAKIGDNTLIYHGVTLGAYATDPKDKDHRHPEIGSDCTISTGVKILGHVIVKDKSKIGPQAFIAGDDVTIGNNTRVKPGTRIMNGNHIGDNVTVGAGSVIAENSGEINQNIPPDSHVSRIDGKLHITSLNEQEGLLQQLQGVIKGLYKGSWQSISQ